MHLASYLGLLWDSEESLANAAQLVGAHHGDEPEIAHLCKVLGDRSAGHMRALDPVVERYGEHDDPEPGRLQAAEFRGTREGSLGLLRDLQDLYVLASFVHVTWTVVGEAAEALHDHNLVTVVRTCETETAQQLDRLRTRLKEAAPRALVATD
ncbi:MAG TPA: hypothetical protein VGD34_24595 [Kribbella sp.]